MMRRWIRFAVWMTLTAILAMGSYRFFVLSPVHAHGGDGQFQDISRRAGPFAMRGYDISMPTFDLGEPLTTDYRVTALPGIGRDCGVYLAFRDPEFLSDHLLQRLGGSLELEVLNRAGRRLAGARGSLKDFTCFQTFDLHAFYQPDNSFFTPDSGEEYTIRCSYTPDTQLAGHRGFVYLRSGGGK
jgi:hypothetical protein